jgi:hypothetical protein
MHFQKMGDFCGTSPKKGAPKRYKWFRGGLLRALTPEGNLTSVSELVDG